jgi:hypothetical protein
MINEHDFQFLPAHQLGPKLDAIPEAAGVYLILQRAGAVGLPDDILQSTATMKGIPLLYVGASRDNIRSRLKTHLMRDSNVSPFRMSVGVLLREQLQLTIRPISGQRTFWFDREDVLSDWLRAHTIIGFRKHAAPFEIEKSILTAGGGLLNLRDCPPSAFSSDLLRLRREASAWPHRAKYSDTHPH